MSIDQRVRLGVELGTSRLRAAVAWPDGTAMVLPLAGVGWLDTGALTDVGLVAAARVHGAADGPRRDGGGGRSPSDDAAAVALFGQVVSAAREAVGGGVDVVTLAVDAGRD